MEISNSHPSSRGSSLIEVVIAVGVMAVAVPLVFGALAESGKSNFSAEAETRSTWIIPACMEEIRASREGRPQFFTATVIGQSFPPVADIWALAFSPEGKAIGKISKSQFEKGIKELDGQRVLYLASLTAAPQPVGKEVGNPKMLEVRVTLEYPSGSPLIRRQKIDFFTRIP